MLKIVQTVRHLFSQRALFFLLIIIYPLIGNSYAESQHDEFEEVFSEYLVASGEYFCVSELFTLCFSDEDIECGSESEEYKLLCLSSVKPLYSSGSIEFDPNVVLNKYLNCIVDKQLGSFSESRKSSYKRCLGARFKNK
ncbi:hypothetical protein ACJJI3_07455 [Microbulbifer sp. ZKSA004]|uniref:hypothetical protein n=1 Tax=Microbulbifer sp. ZKSA004 TaxID=3243389 RepID=UPI004039BD18